MFQRPVEFRQRIEQDRHHENKCCRNTELKWRQLDGRQDGPVGPDMYDRDRPQERTEQQQRIAENHIPVRPVEIRRIEKNQQPGDCHHHPGKSAFRGFFAQQEIGRRQNPQRRNVPQQRRPPRFDILKRDMHEAGVKRHHQKADGQDQRQIVPCRHPKFSGDAQNTDKDRDADPHPDGGIPEWRDRLDRQPRDRPQAAIAQYRPPERDESDRPWRKHQAQINRMPHRH